MEHSRSIPRPARQNIWRQTATGRLLPKSLSGKSDTGLLSQPELSAAQTVCLNQLEELLQIPALQDLVTDQQGSLWIDWGAGLNRMRWHQKPTRQDLAAVISLLFWRSGRRIDYSFPAADTVLDGRFRVHGVLNPLAAEYPLLSIRQHAALPASLADLDELLFAGYSRAALDQAVQRRHNLLITGASGTGKTTLLAALLGSVPREERIIAIEDTPELTLQRSNFVQLTARQANAEGIGAISVEQLLKEALRMRPDRLVLGECRGAELSQLLSALNTGHDGGAGTLHLSRLSQLPARLGALGQLAGMSQRAVELQAAAAFDLVIHLERAGGVRRIAAAGRLEYVGDHLRVVPLDRNGIPYSGREAARYG